MNKKIKSALISVYYKDGLESLIQTLQALSVKIYTTGGTQKFIEKLGIACIPVEDITGYPSILDGRVKTLHPKIFGGILSRRNQKKDNDELLQFEIPEIDLVIIDLYPFAETVATTTEEQQITEKIDIGGPSMIRAAAKNYNDVTIIASKSDYQKLENILKSTEGNISLAERKTFAAKAFEIVMKYDIDISNYFNQKKIPLRYGENPHQQASFTGKLHEIFTQIHGKEISYNNLVDIDAGFQLLKEFENEKSSFFAIIKHTNVCGAALKQIELDAWNAALAGDPESAFGGVIICNCVITKQIATSINEIFFEVLIADDFENEALEILQQKKNRILLKNLHASYEFKNEKSILNGMLQQDIDNENYKTWNEEGGAISNEKQKEDLLFANILCKHLKSNAIVIVKDKQLIGKGCGQTSRIDALKQAIEKSQQFNFDLSNAVIGSDAFFPFDDCVKIAHSNGITAFIQPGGSIRDKDSFQYCIDQKLVMVTTGIRHFKH